MQPRSLGVAGFDPVGAALLAEERMLEAYQLIAHIKAGLAAMGIDYTDVLYGPGRVVH